MNYENKYYVIHDYELRKGKMRKLLGDVVVSNKKSLIPYVKKYNETDDITVMRIMPVNNPKYLIFVSEHGGAYLYE